MLGETTGRVPITDQARLIAETSQPLGNTASFDHLPSNWQKWEVVKPEMYAICAVLSNDVVDKGLSLLVDGSNIVSKIAAHSGAMAVRRPTTDVFENLYFYTRDTLLNALDQERVNKSKQNLWKRYGYLDRLLQCVRQRPRGRDALAAGLGTAAKIMADTLRVIPEVCLDKGGGDCETFLSIARSSYPFLAQFAMLQIGDFAIKDDSLRFEGVPKGYFNPSRFDLIQTKNGMVLVAKEKPFPDILDFREPFVGCPASIKVREGESSVIRKLWDWHVSVAMPLWASSGYGNSVSFGNSLAAK